MVPKNLSLILNSRLRLDDSILVIAAILGIPLIHIVVSLSRVIQIIQVVHHPRGALLVISHERVVETGMRQLRLCIYQDHYWCFLAIE
jgi:hypothetical protein